MQGGHVGADVNYWTSIFPFIVLMSIGMGLTFVPLTLTAVHHVRAEDSGIGSGVLNTMQQVGGALGLAILEHGRAQRLRAARGLAGRCARRGQGCRPGGRPSQLAFARAPFTEGATSGLPRWAPC